MLYVIKNYMILFKFSDVSSDSSFGNFCASFKTCPLFFPLTSQTGFSLHRNLFQYFMNAEHQFHRILCRCFSEAKNSTSIIETIEVEIEQSGTVYYCKNIYSGNGALNYFVQEMKSKITWLAKDTHSSVIGYIYSLFQLNKLTEKNTAIYRSLQLTASIFVMLLSVFNK